MEWLSDPNAWIALASLTALEIVLGIDNIVFISVLAQKLPVEHQARVRTLGLALAMAGRIVLLLGISWVMGLTKACLRFIGWQETWMEEFTCATTMISLLRSPQRDLINPSRVMGLTKASLHFIGWQKT